MSLPSAEVPIIFVIFRVKVPCKQKVPERPAPRIQLFLRVLKYTIWSAFTLRKWRGACFQFYYTTMKVTTERCLNRDDCIFRPLCLFVHEDGGNDQLVSSPGWPTLYSPDVHYQLDFLDQENSVILSTIYSPLSWITGCLAKKYSGDHSIASQKYLETTWWDLL